MWHIPKISAFRRCKAGASDVPRVKEFGRWHVNVTHRVQEVECEMEQGPKINMGRLLSVCLQVL